MRTWLWAGCDGTHVIQILVLDGDVAFGITYGGFFASDDHVQMELTFALPNRGAGWIEVM